MLRNHFDTFARKRICHCGARKPLGNSYCRKCQGHIDTVKANFAPMFDNYVDTFVSFYPPSVREEDQSLAGLGSEVVPFDTGPLQNKFPLIRDRISGPGAASLSPEPDPVWDNASPIQKFTIVWDSISSGSE